MYKDKKVVVVMPAYNAALTLEKTYAEVPRDLVDEVILCDDASKDETTALAKQLGVDHVITHPRNRGYGGNQKSLYNKALEIGADIVLMVHPDYQYTPLLIPTMPLYKYVANRFLTATQNFLVSYKLSEYHTGYRAFSREVLETIDFNANDDDFVFDNELLSQIIYHGFDIAEVTCPTKYFEEASSINFVRSSKYGLGVLRVSVMHRLNKWGLLRSKIYQ